MIRSISIAVLALFILTSCGEKADQVSELIKTAKNAAENAERMADKAEKMEEKQKERKESGDTVAMTTDELLPYLPGSIAGYEAQEAETETMQMQAMSWTKVSRKYTSDNGNVQVDLIDYNASPLGWMGASAILGMKFRSENSREVKGTFETDNENINGYEEFNKKSGRVNLTYGVGGRFLLTIKADKQESSEWAKDLAEGMELDELASK